MSCTFRNNPTCIQRFSRNWNIKKPKFYIYAEPGQLEKAQDYIERNISSSVHYVEFEYVEQWKTPIWAMCRTSQLSKNSHLQCLKLQCGSILCRCKDLDTQNQLLNEGRSVDDFDESMGSLGCFIKGKDDKMWVLTASHTLQGDGGSNRKPVERQAIVTQYDSQEVK